MSFSKKQISLVFTLGKGQFGKTGANQVTVSGLRISAKIVKTGSSAMSECQLRVFGLTPTIYNSLTSIYPASQGMQRNTVTVFAGDTKPLTAVFTGQIQLAQIDLNSQPDSVMNIIAQTALLQALQPATPLSYPVGVSVATAMENLATLMQLKFENNAVTAVLPKSYFSGTLRQQALAIVKASGIKWNGGDDDILAIWPANGSRASLAIPTISYLDNMIGYPSYSNIGIGVKCRYNPNINYGGQVKVKSSLKVPGINGLWTVFGLAHTLESEMPDGQWMTEIQGFNPAVISQ